MPKSYMLWIKWRFAITVLVLGIVLMGAFTYHPTRWRLNIIGLKLAGRLDTVDWIHLLHMIGPSPSISLEVLTDSGDPFAAIYNPLGSAQDRTRGKEMFGRRCSQCHGDDANGGVGPSLIGRQFTYGDSDWALFRTISNGVPGTAMRSSGIPDDDVWRIITFLRGLPGKSPAESSAGAESVASVSDSVRDTTYTMLREASTDVGNWLLPAGSYNSQRFSIDTQINSRNVSQLSVQWIHQFGTKDARIESTPIIVDGWMYVTLPHGTVIAIDAASGAEIWKYTRTPPPDWWCCFDVNRGVSIRGGRVYVGTVDAHLLALDATSGKLLWDQTVANYHENYSITSAPLALDKVIVTGVGGGDSPTRGFISAYDPVTGALRWRFKTIPEPGEPGNETWGGESWRTGGVATWLTGSFDPELDLIYWGTGNPAPDFNAASRPGDNLYSNCVVALDAASGKLAWYFQFTPGDDHDWDSVQTPILINMNENGVIRKLLVVANRNSFFYVLDRQTGRFLRAAPFVEQTWALGLTPEGRPIKRPNSSPSLRGTRLSPSLRGGTLWWPSSYSPLTQLYYVPALERGGVFFSSETPPEPLVGQLYVGGAGEGIQGEHVYTAIRAIDPATAKVRWERPWSPRFADAEIGGLLSTKGGLVFGSDVSKFFALDAGTGALLWSFETGGKIIGAPVTFRAGGRQLVAIAAGQALLAFGLPESN